MLSLDCKSSLGLQIFAHHPFFLVIIFARSCPLSGSVALWLFGSILCFSGKSKAKRPRKTCETANGNTKISWRTDFRSHDPRQNCSPPLRRVPTEDTFSRFIVDLEVALCC
jgi:hypothetical protein